MSGPSWCELVESNVERFGDLVAGIDPHLPDLPAFFDSNDDGAWIGRFADFVIDTIEGRIGFVKFQSAYFEACGLAGLGRSPPGSKGPGRRALASFSTANAAISAPPPRPTPALT